MQTSIEQVIENFKTLVEANFDEINVVDFQKYGDAGLDKNGVQLIYDLEDNLGTYDLNVDTLNVHFEILDLLSTIQDPDERRKFVISDCNSIGSMLVSYIRNESAFSIQDSVNVTKVEKRYKDGLGGVEFNLTFTLQKTCLV